MPGSLVLKAATLICALKIEGKRRFSIWNATMVRNKLSENVARIT